jgi:hypothetical protein
MYKILINEKNEKVVFVLETTENQALQFPKVGFKIIETNDLEQQRELLVSDNYGVTELDKFIEELKNKI